VPNLTFPDLTLSALAVVFGAPLYSSSRIRSRPSSIVKSPVPAPKSAATVPTACKRWTN